LTRRLFIRGSIAVVALIAVTMLSELALEVRDVDRYMPGQTFVQVGDARIRYRLMGTEHRGAMVVFLTGLSATIEQADYLQPAVSSAVPTLVYDRAGYGFSRGSVAHNGVEQADELAGVLHALKIEQPVVLVAYSNAGEIARVFVARYPQRTARLYLIEPWMPELALLMPQHGVLHYYGRTAIQNFLKSLIGIIRLNQHLQSPPEPKSLARQRVDAAEARISHNWAVLAEWARRPQTGRQAIASPVPHSVPVEVAYTKSRFSDTESNIAVEKMYADLVAPSSHGTLVQFEHVDHERLMQPSLMFEPMAARIRQLSLDSAH